MNLTHWALALVKRIREPHGVKKSPLLAPSVLFMESISTLIYTSELNLCSANCVYSATRLNIHMCPYFLFVAIHHSKVKSAYKPMVAHQAGAYSGFFSKKRLEVFLLPLDAMLVHCRLPLALQMVPIYTLGWR